MHLRAHVKYIVKGKTPETRGMIGADYTIGKEKPLELEDFFIGLVGSAIQVAVGSGLITNTEELQDLIAKVNKWAKALTIEVKDVNL